MRDSNPVVGRFQQPIEFKTFDDQNAYFSLVREKYRELGNSWLTPAEIFRPHYGNAFANYVAEQACGEEKLIIYEIGGGTGTLALDMLNWLRLHAPNIYSKVTYTCLEISHSLATLQKQRLVEHQNKFDVRIGDAVTMDTWGGSNNESCWVIATEIFDNMPHDRVWRGNDDQWLQTEIILENRRRMQIETELRDPLIQECLSVWDKSRSHDKNTPAQSIINRLLSLLIDKGEAVFLPTGALQLFKALHAARPQSRLLASDFDLLPEVVMQGECAPLVASTLGGKNIDYATYLDPLPGTADIFFPSNFHLLQALYCHASQGKKQAEVWKCSTFFKDWAVDIEATKTKNGYNPFLEDYSNTSMLITSMP